MNKEYMMRMKPNRATITGLSSSPVKAGQGRVHDNNSYDVSGLDIRPCGMFVQKRNSDYYKQINSNTVPNIKLRVKYGSSYHEVIISSQASFGELKKILSGITGLHVHDQKLIYKEKERDSKAFLDTTGVRDGSKIVLVEDELSRERRCLETRKNAKMDKAAKEIDAIRFEVDNLAKQMASVKMEINAGKSVVETVLLNLIELLMTQLIKLDAIDADGDVKLQRRMQVKRVQKYIETLDLLKIRNSGLSRVSLQHQHKIFTGHQMPINYQNKQELMKQDYYNPGPVVVTTKWQTF